MQKSPSRAWPTTTRHVCVPGCDSMSLLSNPPIADRSPCSNELYTLNIGRNDSTSIELFVRA